MAVVLYAQRLQVGGGPWSREGVGVSLTAEYVTPKELFSRV